MAAESEATEKTNTNVLKLKSNSCKLTVQDTIRSDITILYDSRNSCLRV